LQLLFIKVTNIAWSWWLTPVIIATGEAEIRRIVVQGQPRQTVLQTTIFKTTRAK
jgi:hypothetical protein